MVTKDELHKLIDALPAELHREAAQALAQVAAAQHDPVLWALYTAPDDDEPITAEERKALAEADLALRHGWWLSERELADELARTQAGGPSGQEHA